MASTLSRVTDFVPATPILSGEVDSEFNQLVNLLNATSSNIKATLKVSDSGDPPLELNQLSTGPILKGFQGGVENFRIRNNGGVRTPGIYDSNDNEELLFVATGSAVNEFTITNAATTGRPKISATGSDANIGIDIIPKGTGVVKIQSASPVANEDAANKAYVDARKVSFIVGLHILDPSTATVDSRDFGSLVIPGGGAYTITKLKLMFRNGSHTAGVGNVLTVTFDRSGVGDIGSISLNDTNNTVGAIYENNIADITPSENEVFTARITTQTGTITERGVMAMFEGYRTGFN